MPHDFKSKNIIKPKSCEEFKDILKKNKVVFIIFYAEWCGYCQKAEPEIKKLADRKGTTIPIVAIDASDLSKTPENKCIVDALKGLVKGYPTIAVSYMGYVRKYNGERVYTEYERTLSFLVNQLTN
uniref:Thioredoxin domain-containing protein n=1 Tax=viral metagenome TaxID=1070528 RepID=A0A6C0CJ78_9ZZZZ